MELLVFDIGGTDLKYGVIRDGAILLNSKMESNGALGGAQIIEKIIRIANDLKNDFNPDGIGVCTAGVVNTNTGCIIAAANNIKDYIGTNIKAILEEKLGLETWVLNDVNSLALSEINDGAASLYHSIVCLTIGTGIGGGIIIDNKLIDGASFGAGEIGLMITNKGKFFEKVAATMILVNNCSKVYSDIKNGEDVFKYYDNNDEKIIEIVDEFYNDLAIGIANLVYILNPQAIVIGGGITNRGDKFLQELDIKIKKHLSQYYYDNTKILISKNKNNAGMIGAYFNFLKIKNS